MCHYTWTWTQCDELILTPAPLAHVSSASSRLVIPGKDPIFITLVYHSPVEPTCNNLGPLTDLPLPLLKSNLQKAIRRRLTQVAVHTACELFRRAPMELLRRLPIIALEDVMWMPAMSRVVWLMLYGQKKQALDSFLPWVLSVTEALCRCEAAFDDRGGKTQVFPPVFEIWHTCPTDNTLTALLVRHCYGGMKGDMALLSYGAWCYHQNPNLVVTSDLVRPWTSPVPSFSEQDMLLEAIDFHCSDIIQEMQHNHPFPASTWRTWIWNYRSGLNVRKPWTQPSPPPVWYTVVDDLDNRSMCHWKTAALPKRKRKCWSREVSSRRQRLMTDFMS